MIRTYYWHDNILPDWKIKLRNLIKRDGHKYFRVGNAGDLLTKEIIKASYQCDSINTNDSGNRLLIVGSVSHRVRPGDVLCGIGTQGKANALSLSKDVTIYGLRGPLSYDEFKNKGYDVSGVKFLLDPGLLVRFMYNRPEVTPEKGKVVFIPHYKERAKYKSLSSKVTLVDIDDYPENVCYQILSAEHVLSSSLHGIIFAHALFRPVTFVKPDSESMLKYEDYYASINVAMPDPLKIFNGKSFIGLELSPKDLDFKKEDFFFPSVEELKSKGVHL